jgi:hypothetical protein
MIVPFLVRVLAPALLLVACGRKGTSEGTGAASAGLGRSAPPLGSYQVLFEAPPPAGSARPSPVPAAERPWRVWVNQEVPRQKPNPHWKPSPIKETTLLEMAADGRWRCAVTPAEVLARIGEDLKLGSWQVSRRLVCSNDGWLTNVEERAQVTYGLDGKVVDSKTEASLILNDQVGGKPRVTVVGLRTDG